MNSFAELPVAQGQILAEKYRIDYLLGQRGTGMVVAAEHLALRTYVAIKVLRTSATAETVERFFREARAAASVASDHVVRVLDLDRLPTGEPYIVMELLEGKTLAVLLEQQGPLSVPNAVDYLLHACEAIGKAHAAGIIHRELKPANLFLTQDESGAPSVKVLDFGVCKLAASSGGPAGWLTGASTLLGSPAHMAPEQWVSATNVSASTDIWALGAILYELLAGRPAFAGEDLAALCNAVQHHAPVPLATFRPDVPAGLRDVIERCLAKQSGARPVSAAHLGLAIAPWGTAVGHLVMDELQKLTADPSRPERAGAAATMVVSVQDPRVNLPTPAPAQPSPVPPEISSAPTFAVHGVTVHDPAIASAPGAGGAPAVARTASGTVQLAAMAEPRFDVGALSAPPPPPGGVRPAAPPGGPLAAPARPLPATLGMPAVGGAALPPTVRMASIPPAPVGPAVGPPVAAWGSSSAAAVPMGHPSTPPPGVAGTGGGSAPYSLVAPAGPRPSAVAPTVVGAGPSGGRAASLWILVALLVLIVVVVTIGGLLLLLR